MKIENILKIVLRETGKTIDDLKCKTRRKDLVFARAAFACLARHHGYSYPKIGLEINRDHTTVINLLRIGQKNELIKSYLTMSMDSENAAVEEIKRPNKYRYVYDLYGGKCAVCGFDEVLEIHHIVPKYLGGGNQLSNLIVLCPNHHALADRGMLKITDVHIKNGLSTPPITTTNNLNQEI